MGNRGADTLVGSAGDDVIFGDLDPNDDDFDPAIHFGNDVIVWSGSTLETTGHSVGTTSPLQRSSQQLVIG